MAYYNSDFESWYEANASSYPSWTPGTEYATANAAGRAGQQGAPVFASQPASRGFNHGGRPPSLPRAAHRGFIGAMTQHETFGRLAKEQGQVLITNEEAVKQVGQSFHLPKMVSVNAPVLDCERVLSQAVSQIRLSNDRASTKYNVMLHRFNKFHLANSAAKSTMTAFDSLALSPLFSFAAMEVFTADGTLVNLSTASLVGPDAAAQLVLREMVSFVTVSVIVHPKLLAETCRTPTKTFSSAMFELPRDPLINAYAPSLETLLDPTALMEECQATTVHLKLVRFNGGSNPIPFTSHSC
jgi:hypothetical protein